MNLNPTRGPHRGARALFSIEDRDPHSPEWKRIRVVTTIESFRDD